MTLDELNRQDVSEAESWFVLSCASKRWAQNMVSSRPFASEYELIEQAKLHWAALSEEDYLEAFEAHPMIGNINSLRARFSATKNIASDEQSGVSKASEETLEVLSDMNHQYLAKNGFIFIICATGLTADIMLNALKKRIKHSRDQEITIAAAEQINITILRLNKAFSISKLKGKSCE